MKVYEAAVAVCSGIVLVVASFLGATPLAEAEAGIRYVAPGGLCTVGHDPCYASVQAAVDAAATADEIRIATGAYTDVHTRPRRDTSGSGVVSQVVYVDKTVTVRGGYNLAFTEQDPDAYPTTLDAQGAGRGFYITGSISPTIEGLRITGGDASSLGGYDYYGSYNAGGNVYAITATVTLRDNYITDGIAQYGGGVFLNSGTGTLDGNVVSGNQASSGGGGVFLYEGAPWLVDNTIDSNHSDNIGGGLYLFATSAIVQANSIVGNNATSLGGGIDVASCSPALSGNLLSGNRARNGGGAYLWYNQSVLTNNVFIDNQATDSGSGLWIGGSAPTMLHATVNRNPGGDGSGIYIGDAGTTHSSVAITNTVIANQVVGISIVAGSSVLLDGILWNGTPTTVLNVSATVITQHQYTGDPRFDADGYHLTATSAAVDRGVRAGVAVDIDGQPRAAGDPDLGADEYWPPGLPIVRYLPLLARGH